MAVVVIPPAFLGGCITRLATPRDVRTHRSKTSVRPRLATGAALRGHLLADDLCLFERQGAAGHASGVERPGVAAPPRGDVGRQLECLTRLASSDECQGLRPSLLEEGSDGSVEEPQWASGLRPSSRTAPPPDGDQPSGATLLEAGGIGATSSRYSTSPRRSARRLAIGSRSHTSGGQPLFAIFYRNSYRT